MLIAAPILNGNGLQSVHSSLADRITGAAIKHKANCALVGLKVMRFNVVLQA